jgi:hypothetical protein
VVLLVHSLRHERSLSFRRATVALVVGGIHALFALRFTPGKIYSLDVLGVQIDGDRHGVGGFGFEHVGESAYRLGPFRASNQAQTYSTSRTQPRGQRWREGAENGAVLGRAHAVAIHMNYLSTRPVLFQYSQLRVTGHMSFRMSKQAKYHPVHREAR